MMWCYRPIYLCILKNAVYLYLLTLNQILQDEGNLNNRHGHLIVNKSVGLQFVGTFSTKITYLHTCRRTYCGNNE